MSQRPALQPVSHNPAAAPTIDTSPEQLQLPPAASSTDPTDPPSSSDSRIKRISNAVEKTVDRLSKSVSGKSSSSPSTPAQSSPRRIFSISRRNKRRAADEDLAEPISSSNPVSSSPLSPPKSGTSASGATPTDESAEIESSAVVLQSAPPRPALSPFRGDGSMRAGTQTLIQALQAIPWTESDNEDEAAGNDAFSTGSENEDDRPTTERQSSSIHTIHRPVARSRRSSKPAHNNKHLAIYSPVNEASEDDVDIEDFEEETPRPPFARPSHLQHKSLPPPEIFPNARSPFHSMSNRSGSMATIRLHRRAHLAEKLRDVFELDNIKEVWAEMPCWLLRSVLLQGYMYLTNSYLCFFAHMPSREDQVLKSGSLNKKAHRTKRWIKHWFVLKNDALSWYQSSSDPYFPHGIVDLRYAISCDPSGERDIRLRTHQKTVILSAYSVQSREEWLKAIRKVIFKAQNMGESVKIAIPYSVILDVERSSAMDFSETIEVKVADNDEQYPSDSYFFAYFHDLSGALEQIRDALRTYGAIQDDDSPQTVIDTTSPRLSSIPLDLTTTNRSKSPSGFRLSSLLRPFSDNGDSDRQNTGITDSLTEEHDLGQISLKNSNDAPLTMSPKSIEPPLLSSESVESQESGRSPRSLLSDNHAESSNSWVSGVPSWLKSSRRGRGSSTTTDQVSTCESATVREVYSSSRSSPGPLGGSSVVGDMTFSVLDSPETTIDFETVEKFKSTFAYDEKETLLGYFPGYIYRVLPVYGKLYISKNFFCFKSSGPLTAKTRMTLPLRDILVTEKSKAPRFGHYGLIIIVKGHEEIFFEFGDEDKREAFISLLERQIEDVKRRLATGETSVTSPGKREALILEEFEATSTTNNSNPAPPSESVSESLPAVMFTSAESTFLTFKPNKPMHFTFLTIGSRGDVQPYIALSKGLMADGHICRIATHGEFREWIESHGIEFGFVGGDPAELMRICVENGMFTVSFLKEGLQKFRGWLDDLLKTSWEACQGTDVLIESPSAMGGYHIAEALSIPYFRAFTMTWTRTRAYPHAFAVPERKMGGSYNYMSYVMFDQVFWRATSGQINRWRRNMLDLGATSLDKMEPHKIPFLYNFSPHVVPPPLDWPEWIRVTGYWFLDDADVSAKKWSAPDRLVKFIDNAHQLGKKVVYIGFGSIVVSDPKAMTRCVVEAVLQSGVYAILSKGWSDRLHVKAGDAAEPEEPLPAQIFSISSVPHDWLFKRIDAACHHGGAGTTGASLRAGIPTIIRPFFGDQYFWADRVESLGVGSGVRKLTIGTLKDAFVAATTDVKQIERAKLLGEQIRAEDGVATAIESIYRDLEYARSLIKKTDKEESSEESAADIEHSTIRYHNSAASQVGSYPLSEPGTASEDLSAISEQDDRRSSVSSERGPSKDKRSSFTSAVLSTLPNSFNTKGSPRRPSPSPALRS